MSGQGDKQSQCERGSISEGIRSHSERIINSTRGKSKAESPSVTLSGDRSPPRSVEATAKAREIRARFRDREACGVRRIPPLWLPRAPVTHGAGIRIPGQGGFDLIHFG